MTTSKTQKTFAATITTTTTQTVYCSPAPRLYWTKRGGSLPSHGRYVRPASRYNSELEIHRLRQTDQGDYVCTAENSQGTRQTVIRLDVQGMLQQQQLLLQLLLLPLLLLLLLPLRLLYGSRYNVCYCMLCLYSIRHC